MKKGTRVADIDERARYDAWWLSGPGQPCVTCKQGDSDAARVIREQGPSFFPMRPFGPDRKDVPVRYLLVGEEPSEDWYDDYVKKGKDPKDARNFGGATPKSLDSVLQFAAREWLCEANETFLLTDMAKCPVRYPNKEPTARRMFRWSNCAPILTEEAGLFDLRAVIAVGKEVRPELRSRPWIVDRPLFRVLHFSPVAVAHRERILSSAAERDVDDESLERYGSFMQERRRELRESVDQQELARGAPKVPDGAKVLLAVYRKQFTCIKRALANPTYDCGQRNDGTCCKAVSRPAPSI